MNLHIVILAAGQGTRMKSRLPKVLQPLAGRALLGHVLDVAAALQPSQVHVVIGHGADEVRAAFADAPVEWVLQAEQKGTGHALAQALPAIPDEATVLVLYGDVPLIGADTLRDLVAQGQRGLAILTVVLDDPQGYGRILRDAQGGVRRIVEHKDAQPDEREIREVNTGFISGPAGALRRWTAALDCHNAQGEYYLTDCVAASVAEHHAVQAVVATDVVATLGVNDRQQLAQLERHFQRRGAAQLLQQGLALADPERIDIRGRLQHGRDCQVDVGCVFAGTVTLGDEVQIGPYCVLENVQIGSGVRIEAYSHLNGAELGPNCVVGPYARLRPGTRLAQGAKVGNFVEIKQTDVGEGSKINHLSYVGDATLGRDVNVGAGTITCNYDGVNKHRTQIGDGAFIGSNSALVAPVEVGPGATIGAGSTVTKSAPGDALTVARARQASYPHWKRPTKR